MRSSSSLACLALVSALTCAPAFAVVAAQPVGGNVDPADLSGRASSPDLDDVGTPSANDGAIPYVIVTDRSLGLEFQRLAGAHSRDGLTARVRTLQSIRVAYPGGRDDAERIRMFLQDAHSIWGTQWVLLGGEDPLIPERRALVRLSAGTSSPDVLLPTDQYYACLDGSWNADGDDLWGELPYPSLGEPGDDVDLIPELNVGRAPVTTRKEARLFVRKTLTEMRAQRKDAPPSILLAAGVIDLGSSVLDLATVTEPLLPIFASDPQAHIARLYKRSSDWPGSFPESAEGLRDSLDRGYDVAVMSGSGGAGIFVAGHYPEDNLTAGDLLKLANGPRWTHVFLSSAYTNVPDALSIGAALMRAERGGAVTVIGSTDIQLLGAPGGFMQEFFRQAYVEHVPTIGEAMRRTIELLWAPGALDLARLTLQGNLLFGDPALELPGSAAPELAAVKRGPRDRPHLPVIENALELAPARPFPNPTSTVTRMDFVVPQEEVGAPLRVTVLDVAGRRIRMLTSGAARAGNTSVAWDLRDDSGARVREGLYFVRVDLGARNQVFRVVVVK